MPIHVEDPGQGFTPPPPPAPPPPRRGTMPSNSENSGLGQIADEKQAPIISYASRSDGPMDGLNKEFKEVSIKEEKRPNHVSYTSNYRPAPVGGDTKQTKPAPVGGDTKQTKQVLSPEVNAILDRHRLIDISACITLLETNIRDLTRRLKLAKNSNFNDKLSVQLEAAKVQKNEASRYIKYSEGSKKYQKLMEQYDDAKRQIKDIEDRMSNGSINSTLKSIEKDLAILQAEQAK
jgi:hypothetical protein